MNKSKELLINMKDVPVWDPSKHYFDQKTNVRQFWQEELRKIHKGVKIGPYRMHPWLYFHLNIYKTPIPQANGADRLMHPPLSDNEMLIADSLTEAERLHKILALFGTRGFQKTTFISSHIHYKMLTTSQGIYSIIGGSELDLKSIASMTEKTFTNVTPAFYLPTLKKDWGDHVKFGFKDKSTSGKAYVHGEISIANANAIQSNSTEKGAGLSPIGFVIDEAGKGKFKDVLRSAIPSFRTPYGFRATPIISGTSGNIELAKDAKDVLEHTAQWEVLKFDYKRLSRGVPEEFITWRDDKDKDFGTFVPAQMSRRLKGIKKLESNLSTYLNIKHKDLEAIPIDVTDWKKATEWVQELHKLGNSGKDEEAMREQMYYPLKIDDIFQTRGSNPFPVHALNKRIKELEDKGIQGKRVQLYKENGAVKYMFSDKNMAEIEHPGGAIDAPFVLFTSIPETPPDKYFNIAGLDDYKADISGTDSLGSLYILQRRNLSPGTPCEKILLSLNTRPNRHIEFHEQIELGLEAFNSECFMEAADTTFVGFLEGKNKHYEYLSPATTFAPSKEKMTDKKLNTRFGLPATEHNNIFRMNVLINWAWEQHNVGFDENNNPVMKYSVEFIDDIDLLKQMLLYRRGKNVDRIVAFSHALLKCFLLDKEGVLPKNLRKPMTVLNRDRKDNNGLQKPKISSYSEHKFNPYGRR